MAIESDAHQKKAGCESDEGHPGGGRIANDGMKAWILDKYGAFGVSVSREFDDSLVMSFPKDFSNFTDVVRGVDDKYGSVCDLSYDEDGAPEVKFWKGGGSKVSAGNAAIQMMMYIAVVLILALAIALLWLQGAGEIGDANQW